MQDKISNKTLTQHLKDFKASLFRTSFLLIFAFFVNLFYIESIFEFLIKLGKVQNLKLIFTSVEGALLTKLSLSFQLSLIFLAPYFAIEMLIFSKEALSKKTFKQAIFILIAGIILYALSLSLTVKFIIPLFVNFLMSFGFFSVDFYISTSNYISFVTKTLTVFAFIFETPVILILGLKLGIIKLELLTKNRKFIFVFCFLLGAVLTPPDVLSQITAAILLYIFFEIAIFIAKKLR